MLTVENTCRYRQLGADLFLALSNADHIANYQTT